MKIAPYSKLTAVGYNQLNVMLYGGGLWRTWFDRDLNIAGKVIIQAENGKLESRLWNAKKPLVKLPNLAIHLAREETSMEKETQLKPVIAMSVVENIFAGGIEKIADDKFKVDEKHFSSLTNLMANDLGVKREQIVDFELNLCDSMPS
jgi:aspartyl aminopeptidase